MNVSEFLVNICGHSNGKFVLALVIFKILVVIKFSLNNNKKETYFVFLHIAENKDQNECYICPIENNIVFCDWLRTIDKTSGSRY